MQSPLRRITNTAEEGININPSMSGDGRFVAFESTEDVAGTGGVESFRAIRANVSITPATFVQLAAARAPAPAVSQDGSRIAFASKDDPLGTNSDRNSEIFLYDGTPLIQVTNTSPGDIAYRTVNGNYLPSISDDGRFIAFSSNRDLAGQNPDGNLEIFIFDSAAGGFTQLTSSSGIVGFTDAKISGDGASVAYIRDNGATPGVNSDLLLQNRVGAPTSLRTLATDAQNLALTFGRAISDDGTRVVWSAETATNSSQVFLYDGRNNQTRQITGLGVRSTEVPPHPTISGDGSRIAFATRRSVSGAGSNTDGSVELYTYEIPSGTFGRVTNTPSNTATAEVVSSMNDDGSIIAFNFPRVLTGVINEASGNNSEIYVTGTPPRPAFGNLAIQNGASFGHEPATTEAVAPDSIAVAFGNRLSNTTKQAQQQPDRSFPLTVGGTTVTVNGRAAQIFYVSPTQVNFHVPAATELGPAEVIVTNSDGFPSRGTAASQRAAPGVFTYSGDGLGEGVILDANTLQPGPFDPTSSNLRLIIFSTGVRNGAQVSVTAEGRAFTVESIVSSPNMPGLDEVHVLLPADLRGAGQVDLVIRADSRDSNAVTVTFVGDSHRDIVINEFLADPPGSLTTDANGDANRDGTRDSGDDEFVELVNATTHDINVSGYQVLTRGTSGSSDVTRHIFASGSVLPACSAIVVFGGGNPDASNQAFGGAQIVEASSGSLSLINTSGVVTLRDPSGGIVNLVNYGGSSGLNGNADQSLTRSPDIAGNFTLHQSASGSGGAVFSPGTRVNGAGFNFCPAIARIEVSPPTAAIDEGAYQQFMAQAYDTNNQPVSGVIFFWESSNTAVATIDQDGLATGVAPGTTEIRASGRGIQSPLVTLTVNAIQPVLTTIEVTPDPGTTPVSGRQQFTARAFDQFANEMLGLTFTWESTNTNIATVDANGLATGINQGQTTIKAKSGNVTDMATLNVTPPTVIFNEVLADPAGSAAGDLPGDANNDGVRSSGDDEFVELLNSTGAEINLSGWTVRTHPTGNTTETIRHTFATSTSLPPGEAIVVFGGGGPNFDPANAAFACAQVVKASGGLSLTNSGLTIVLRDGSGNMVAQFSYGGSTGLAGDNDQSLTRSPDITGSFVQHLAAAGASGRRFSPGTRVNGTPFGSCPPRLTSISISPPSTTVIMDQSTQFTAQAFDQFGQPITGVTITFASDNTSVATVDSVSTNPGTGVATATVTGRSPGTAHITGQANDGMTTVTSPQATLTVSPAPSADLSIAKADSPDPVAPGATLTYTLTLTNGGPDAAQSVVVTDNLSSDVIFVNCSSNEGGVCDGPSTSPTISFSSLANGATATITIQVTVNNSLTAGTVITNTASVTSTTADPASPNNSDSEDTTVQIPTATVTSVQVAPAAQTINRGGTQQFTATAFNGSNPVFCATFTWNSSNTNVATIDTDGLATGVGIGTTTITATTSDGIGGNVSGTATLTVQVPLVINEVLADPPGSATTDLAGDANRNGTRDSDDDEFVELLNNSNAAVDVSGVVVADAASNRFTFPANTTVAAGRAVVIFGGASPPVSDPAFGGALIFKASSLGLNNAADTVTVKLKISGGDAVIDTHAYGPEASGDQSITRSPDAEVGLAGGSFVQHTTTINAAGRVFSPGTRSDGTPFGSPAIMRIEVLPANAAINIGATQLFVGHAYSDVGGPEMEVPNVSFIWDSSDTAKATVAPPTGQTTTATAIAAGSSTVRARAGGQEGTAALTVNPPPPTLTINNVSQAETDSETSNFTFQVSLSSPAPAGGVTFDIATADDTAQDDNPTEDNDYVARTVIGHTILEGSSTYDFAVTVTGDLEIEPDETFFVNVTNVSGATVGDDQGLGTIQNDDSPSLTINDVIASEGDAGTITFTFTLTSSQPAPAGWITFDIATADGTAQDDNPAGTEDNDYVAKNLTTQTIPLNQTTYTFDVTVNGDLLVEPDETFTVYISNVSGATVSDGTGQGTIQNDDIGLLVISQVYGGGGNANATYTNDFIEIFNRGNTAVDFSVTPYSVQYAAATSTFTTNKTNLTSGVILPGRYFLVQQASGGGGGVPLASFEATGTINLAATAGKVALVIGTTSLTGSGCPLELTIADFLGYGNTADCFETAPIAVSGTNANARSVIRTMSCTDTNNNSADFSNPTAAPTARNSATTPVSCP